MYKKQYKLGQIVTLYGKKYRIIKNPQGCPNCRYFTLPMKRICRWCIIHLDENSHLQEIKPEHE